MMLLLKHRAARPLDPSVFEEADQGVISLRWPTSALSIPDDQYVLRMCIMSPESNGIRLPPELQWLASTIDCCVAEQRWLGLHHPYIYVTVRSGIVRSTTDDEWHVDGFSMRVRHAPEQNYVWTDCYPTEHLDQQFVIPADFDPHRHNIHSFFQDNADTSKIKQWPSEHLHQIDPYIVHRRPSIPEVTQRTFFRISFVPIEIEDDTNTPNPLLARRIYGRSDIRKTLTRYTGEQ